MRRQFVETVEQIMRKDENVITILGDIGVFGFREIFKQYPERIYNIGILEQSSVGLAAGMAIKGLIPIVHTIAPFLVERAYEQLKVDFGYQELGGNFVSVGASYDYAALGSTHHCPGDVGILKMIPNMEIILPGTPKEFDILFSLNYNNGNPTYYRLSEVSNTSDQDVKFGQATVIRKGDKATIIAVATTLDSVLKASEGLEVTILYYTTLAPFDKQTLRNNCISNKILLCEPFYYGVMTTEIIESMAPSPVRIDYLGVPHIFIRNYGKREEHDKQFGFSVQDIRKRIEGLINE